MRGRKTPSVIRAFAAMVAALCLATALAGPSWAENLLENPVLVPVDGSPGAPGGWSLEGDAQVEYTDDGVALVSTGSTPFLFQQVPVDKRLAGSMATLSAWVRSAVPEGCISSFPTARGWTCAAKPIRATASGTGLS